MPRMALPQYENKRIHWNKRKNKYNFWQFFFKFTCAKQTKFIFNFAVVRKWKILKHTFRLFLAWQQQIEALV